MPFTITDFTVDPKSITITFSAAVLAGNGKNGAENLSNYSVFGPRSVDLIDPPPATLQDVSDEHKNTPFKASSKVKDNVVTFNFTPSAGKKEFQPGDFVHLVVSKVQSEAGDPLDQSGSITGAIVEGRVGRMTRDVEDAISYPILTEEIGYRPSPVGIPTGGSSGIGGSGGGGLGQVAAKAVSEVLGWKPSTTDPKGFVGALTQAFTLTDIEGHTESTWNPRTYAVQTDLGGGITGAQASLYMRAKNALDSALPLLDGLYPLDPEADPEYVKALREMARSQMTEIVKELGAVGLPSILRIDTYFGILLGQNPSDLDQDHPNVIFNPDQIAGTLGELRDTYGIQFAGNEFNNSVEDEQDITNFRVISDYMTSLMQSWMANRQFFFVTPGQQAFFGTQLVLISRQFTTISETVNELRFALDSVFIGPNERQTLLLEFREFGLAPMFLEDVLNELDKFAGDEGPRLLREGGKISVTNNILPVLRSLLRLVIEAQSPLNMDQLPDGYKTARVHHALDDLRDQIEALIGLIEQVERDVPPSENKLLVTGISKPQLRDENDEQYWVFCIFGNAFAPTATVTINPSVISEIKADVTFYSAQRIDASVTLDLWNELTVSNHDVTVKSNGQSATLKNAFSIDGSGNVGVSSPQTHVAAGKKLPGKDRQSAAKTEHSRKGQRPEFFKFGRPFSPPPAGSGSDAKFVDLKNRIDKLQNQLDNVMKDTTAKQDQTKGSTSKKQGGEVPHNSD